MKRQQSKQAEPASEGHSEAASEERSEITTLSAAQQGMLTRQRVIGNAAVVRAMRAQGLVQRDPPPAAPAPAAVNHIAQLDEMLDRFNVPENEVITLLGQLTPAEKTTVINGGYRGKFASAFNTGEMIRAVTNLGTPLPVSLDWVRAAAGRASSIDYAQIRPLILAAADRSVLNTRPWRDFFVDVCDNNTMPTAVADLGLELGPKLDWMNAEANLNYADIKPLILAAPQAQRDALNNATYRAIFTNICNNRTMAEAVVDLGFPLSAKVEWMADEGTNAELLQPIIRAASQAEIDTVKNTPTLMAALQSDLSSGDWRIIEPMLTQGVLQESTPTVSTEGVNFTTGVTIARSRLLVHKEVKFKEKGTFDPAANMANMKSAFFAAITAYLDNKYKVRVVSPGGAQPGDGDFPINVQATENASADYTVKLHANERGRPSMGSSSGDIFELGQEGTGTPAIEMAHEGSHMLLGAPDEYPDPEAPASRVLTNDHSLMANYYNQGQAAAEIKARHFGFLVTEVQRIYPGRSVTIVQP